MEGLNVTEVRFTDNGDGTITDHKTGLMWEKDTRGSMPWQEAMDSCAALSLAGYTDWRLPVFEELLSIVDYNQCDPSCDSVLKARSVGYWSSSTYRTDKNGAWGVYFHNGDAYAAYKMYSSFVRAVRSGAVNGTDTAAL